MAGELYLIDGNSLAYRAFFALPESIATTDGRPTNAIHGFASMLTKLLVDHRPSSLIVAWDAGMSGREVTFPDYKIQRKPRPDLLKEQWPAFTPLVEAFGGFNVRVEGYEADDVIATVARRARAAGTDTIVVTGDRDAYQLVEDGISVMATSRGVTDTKLYDREGVIERYGIPPELVPDLIALRGDTSDNIPGVPGIGEKTAAQLLNEYGSLEGVLEHAEDISGPKRRQALIDNAELARKSRQLAVLIDDIDLDLDLDESLRTVPDLTGLREFAREYELRSILQRLEEGLSVEQVPVPETPAATEIEVESRPGSPGDLAAGPATLAVAGTNWAASDGNEVVFGEVEDLAGLGGEWGGRELIAHDAKGLGGARGGLLAAAPDLQVTHDTLIAAYLVDPTRRVYELDELLRDEGLGVSGAGGVGPAAEEDEQLSLDSGDEPAGRDPDVEARLVWELAARQRPRLEELGLERVMNEVEMPLVGVLAVMEREGVKLDAERLAEIAGGVAEKAEELQSRIWELAGREFVVGSPQQLAIVLFEELGLSRKRRGKTGFSTDARVLSQIRDEHEIVPLVESWRELTKLKNTYLDSLPGLIAPDTGRIHSTFRQAATTTGRLSSVNPNLQNIPIRTELGRPVRSCFVAEKGSMLISADYNQVELRVLAHIAEDEALREVFATGGDVHTATAAEVLGMDESAVGVGERSKAKMVNYGIAYGLSAFGLADRLGIAQEEAASYIDRYFARFIGVKSFIEATIGSAATEGEVRTLLGRRRPIPELTASRRQDRQLGERLAVNTVIQGTAADIIKLAMVRCHRALAEAGLGTRLVLQIHDELLFEGPESEVPEATEIVSREMCAAFPMEPPLAVDVGVGTDWLSAK